MANEREFIRHCTRCEFHSGKSATKAYESTRFILEDNIVSESTCEFWFGRFKEGDLVAGDRKRSGAPVKI